MLVFLNVILLSSRLSGTYFVRYGFVCSVMIIIVLVVLEILVPVYGSGILTRTSAITLSLTVRFSANRSRYQLMPCKTLFFEA